MEAYSTHATPHMFIVFPPKLKGPNWFSSQLLKPIITELKGRQCKYIGLSEQVYFFDPPKDIKVQNILITPLPSRSPNEGSTLKSSGKRYGGGKGSVHISCEFAKTPPQLIHRPIQNKKGKNKQKSKEGKVRKK